MSAVSVGAASMRLARALAVALALGAAPAAALAQACAGVEVRVNTRTTELGATLATAITEAQAAYVMQERTQRARLLSALRVAARQDSGSSSQEVAANAAAMRGLAQTLVRESVAEQMRTTVRDWSDLGHDPCGLVEAGYAVEEAMERARATREALHEAVVEVHARRTREDHLVAMAAVAEPALEAFLAGLRLAWTEGEVRPTARPKASKPRYRTVPDPLEAVTADLKAWFEADPSVTGRELLDRLQATDPETYPDTLIRTVQRRLKVWRREHARALVLGPSATAEADAAA